MSNPEDPATPAPKGPIVLRIKLRFEDVATFVERFAPNIGRSGLFIRSRTPKTVGTEVRFELRLADDTPVVVGLGVVRWVREYDPQRPRALHGMGVEFSRVTRESREVLLRVLEHRKRVGLTDGPGGIPVPATEDEAETRVVRAPTAPGTGAAPARDDQVTSVRSAPTRRIDGRRPTRPPSTRPTEPEPPTVVAPALSAQIAAAAEHPPVVRRPFDAEPPTRVAPALSAHIAAAAEAEARPVASVDSGPTLARPVPLPPREPRRIRPSAAELVARASSPSPTIDDPPVTMESLAGESLDVETTLRRARSLAGGDPERELRLLLDRSAAPLPITIDDASARLAALVGGSAVAARRSRSGRISSPPPIVADGTQETRPVAAREAAAALEPEPPAIPPPPPPEPSPPPEPPPVPMPPPVPPRPEIPAVPRREAPSTPPPIEIPAPPPMPPPAPDSEPTATGAALDPVAPVDPFDADTHLGFDLSGLGRVATADPAVETTVITPAPLVDVAAEDVASDDDDDGDDPDILVGVPLPRTRRESPLPGVASHGSAEPRPRSETPRFLSDLPDEEPTSLVPPRRAERRSDPPPPPVIVKSAAADMWDLAPARQTSSGSIDITELVAHLEEHAGEPRFGDPTARLSTDAANMQALGADAMEADDMLQGVDRLDRTPSRGGGRRRLPDTHPPDLASFADPPDPMSDEVRARVAPRPARPTPVETRASTVDDIEAALDGLDLDGLDDAPPPRNRAAPVPPPAQHAHQGRPGRPRAPTDDEIEIDIDLDGLDDD